MPLVPEFNHKPLKPIYVPRRANERASWKQRSLILTLYKRRKLPPPDVNKLTRADAAGIISSMLDNEAEVEE
jgi:hypothetical protein